MTELTKLIIEPGGSCYWCALNHGSGTPAYRVLRDMGEYVREADICRKCFEAFGGRLCLEVVDAYPMEFPME